MIALYVQILLLTAAAYVVGAAIACVVRRSFYSTARQEPVAARPVEPLPEVMQRAAGAARFPRGTENEARPAAPPLPVSVTAPLVVTSPAPAQAQAQDLKQIRL